MGIDRSRFATVGVTPDFFEQHFAGEDLLGMCGQTPEQFHFPGCQRQGNAVTGNGMFFDIYLKAGKMKDAGLGEILIGDAA